MKKIFTYCALCLFFYSGLANAYIYSMVLTGNADGSQWKLQLPPSASTLDSYLTNVAQNHNTLFGVGMYDYDEPSIYGSRSDDGGTTWSPAYMTGAGFILSGIAGNDKGWVLIGNNNMGGYDYPYMQFSPDGVNWNYEHPQPPSDCGNLSRFSGIVTDGTQFVATAFCDEIFSQRHGQPGTLTSTDGTNWNWSYNIPPIMQNKDASFNSIFWDGKEFLILATEPDKTPVIMSSLNNHDWTIINVPAEIKSLNSISTSGDTWLAIGTYDNNGKNAPVILKSNDHGTTWNLQKNLPENIVQLNSIKHNDTVWTIAANASAGGNNTVPVILVSKDATNWSQASLPFAISGPAEKSAVNDLLWSGTQWIAVGGYDADAIGCRALKKIGYWYGPLQGPTQKISVQVFEISNTDMKKNGKNDYDIRGDIQYTDDGGGTFGFGPFYGTCSDNNDGSLQFQLSFNNGASIAGARKSTTDNIVITGGWLPDSSGGGATYTGPLSPHDPEKKSKK